MRLGLAGLSLAGLAAASPGAQPGLRIVALDTSPATVVETTTYVQGDRARIEWRLVAATAPAEREPSAVEHYPVARITRCDLQKNLVLSYSDRTYMTDRLEIQPIVARAFHVSGAPANPITSSAPKPNLLIETTTVQTGERKTAFGYAARRVTTTRKDIPLDPAGGSAKEIATDGWYIDLETRPTCERSDFAGGRAVLVEAVSSSGPASKAPVPVFKEIGAPERGYPVEVKTIVRFNSSPDAARSNEHTLITNMVVIDLSREPLDPALFEIPPGFRHAGGLLGAFADRWSLAWRTMRALISAWFR